MPVARDQDVMDSTARLARTAFVSILGQLLFCIGIMIYQVPPLAFLQRPGADFKAAPSAAAGKVADANAAARRAMPRADLNRPGSFRSNATAIVGVAVWIAVGIAAVALPLSLVGPALMTRHSRQGIAAWTWPPSSFRYSKPFTAPVLESDTGKLAYLYIFEFGIGWLIVAFTILLMPFGFFLSGGNPIVLGAAVLLIAAIAVRFPSRHRVASWIERQQELLNQDRQKMRIERQQEVLKPDRQFAVSKPPGTRNGQGLRKPRSRPPRDDGSSGTEDEVCSWLMENAGANDLEHPRELPDQDRQAAGRQRQSLGAGCIANTTSDAFAPPVDPAPSLFSQLKDIVAPASGLRSWEKVQVSLVMTLFLNLVVGLMLWSKFYGASRQLAGWGGWLFLTPFILIGVGMLALFVGQLIAAIKYNWAGKSSRSRRTHGSRASQNAN
jgi:hypothetical protein